MNIELKRQIAAKECGLIDVGVRYNKPTPEDESCASRIFCMKVDFNPDLNWQHFMYFSSNCDKLKKMVVIPAISPKEVFEIAMNKIK